MPGIIPRLTVLLGDLTVLSGPGSPRSGHGGWYVGPSYDGPWISVAAQFVPAPLLRIPVRYYHEPPPPSCL